VKSKKILVIYSGAKHQGGIEKYLLNLFRSYDKKKMKLVLVSLGRWPLCEEVEKIKGKVVVLSGARVAPQNIFKISKLVSSEQASLIVSQGVVANAYGRSAAYLAKVPHLTTVHSDLDLDYSNPLIRSIYSASDKVSRWRTDRYIAVSEHLKKKLVESGVEKDKVDVIYNGVKLETEKSRDRKTHAIFQSAGQAKKPNEIIIGSIGRLHKVKGYENLINAFSMINSSGLKLIIWGDGPERKNLESLIQKLDLKNKVELAGFTDDVVLALSNTDIYIQPSVSEGFGITVVEAMLAGKPVVVTPSGSLMEIVANGKNGIVTKGSSPKSLANALDKLLKDTELIERLGKEAKKDALQRFSVEKWIYQTEKIYLEVAK